MRRQVLFRAAPQGRDPGQGRDIVQQVALARAGPWVSVTQGQSSPFGKALQWEQGPAWRTLNKLSRAYRATPSLFSNLPIPCKRCINRLCSLLVSKQCISPPWLKRAQEYMSSQSVMRHSRQVTASRKGSPQLSRSSSLPPRVISLAINRCDAGCSA
jgi:hypothetical protein